MRHIVIAAGLIASLGLPAAAQSRKDLSLDVRQYITVDAPVVALTHVRVMDGTGAAPVDDQTIVIEGNLITSVGPAGSAKVPAGAKVIDLTGHTVIPGLVGMHDHIHYSAAGWRNINLSYSSPRLYLASGVTTIRTAGSLVPYEDMNVKHSIDRGESPGPRMHLSGPYISGPHSPLPVMAELDSPEEARRVVRYWAEEGATWFKAYTTIRRAEMKAAIDEAHRLGLKVTGHLCSIGYREAVELGFDNLEHGLFVNTEYDPDKKPDLCPTGSVPKLIDLDLNSAPVKATFQALIEHHIAMTSTLPVLEALVPNRPPELDPRMLEAMYPAVKEGYLKARDLMAKNPNAGLSEGLLKKAMAYEFAFYKAGGMLAAGVDNTGNGGALAGLGDQRNFELFIEMGLTPVQALQVMSANGAKVLGVYDKLGSVTSGKLADLVVIKGNPAVTPRDIRNVTLVFKDGLGYDSAKLLASVKGIVGLR